MLSKRVISAAVLIPVVAVCVYLGGLAFFTLVVVAALLAGYEYLRMMRAQGWTPSYVLGLAYVGLFLVDAQWPSWAILRVGLVLVPIATLGYEVLAGNVTGALVRWALVMALGLYVGLLASLFLRLRALDQGVYWMVLALLGTWICDSAAYFVGRSLGKIKLCPTISPKKTWEGAIAGLVAGVLAVVLLGRWLLGLSVGWGLLAGVLLVVGATLGDLAESVIKRQVGVKDSGGLIPGHGGMLDRIDSLLFVVPLIYLFATLLPST
jgi:phosphatidate cytidylyltransferase